MPYLRVANVQRGWLNLEEVKTIAVTPDEKARLLLRRGDVLMNEGGARDKLGRGWIWDGQIAECIRQNHVFRIHLDATYFLQSLFFISPMSEDSDTSLMRALKQRI